MTKAAQLYTATTHPARTAFLLLGTLKATGNYTLTAVTRAYCQQTVSGSALSGVRNKI